MDGRIMIRNKEPIMAKCNYCEYQGMTFVRKFYGKLTFGMAIILSPWGCCIPFLGDCLMDTAHFCQRCGNVIATVSKIDW